MPIRLSVIFLQKLSEREIKKTILFNIKSKILKYRGINLTKDVKDLYSKNYKTLIKEIEDDTQKWNYIHVHGLEELILLKCPYYPKQSADLMQIISKYS